MKNSSKTKRDLLEEISALNRKIHELLQPEAKREWTVEVLRENELWQGILLSNLPAGVVIIDPVTRVIESVNQAAATMFGVGAEQIIGHRCHRFLCPAIEGACPVCDLGSKVDNAEREMVCADGGRRPVLKSVKHVQIRGQAKLLECFIDMSAQKQAEEALRESEARVRTITDSVRDAILMMDPEGRIAYWNPAAERIFGYTREEAAGRELHALLAPARYHEAHYAAFPLFQREGRGGAVGKTLDLEAIRKDRKEIAVQLSLSAIRNCPRIFSREGVV